MFELEAPTLRLNLMRFKLAHFRQLCRIDQYGPAG
jgi:hypothetical protein